MKIYRYYLTIPIDVTARDKRVARSIADHANQQINIQGEGRDPVSGVWSFKVASDEPRKTSYEKKREDS